MNQVKKGILGAILLVLMSAMPLWAIWEGNAGIANSSEFPGSGNFAKSDMFPRNTIVEILNLETNIAIRAVITGSSGVPGLVAILSPEAAAALNVKTGSVSRVRISIPSPVAETPASGTIAAGSGTKIEDPDVNPEAASIEAEKLAALAAPSPDPLVPAIEEPAAEEITESVPTVEVSGETVAPEAFAKTLPETLPEVVETGVEIPEELAIENVEAADPEAFEPAAAEPVPEIAQESAKNPGAVPTETVPEASETAVSAAMFDEPELMVAAVSPAVETPEEIAPPEAEAAESAPEPLAETETLVTLEPAEMLPPPSPEETAPIVALAEIEPAETVPELELPEPVLEPAPVETPVPAPEVALPSVPPAAVDLPFISVFEKGKFYVQIASYADVGNVRRVLETWGAKYPVSVERGASKGNDIFKVYIGPVSRDEYGAVLERFKAAGYRDSFVKKGS